MPSLQSTGVPDLQPLVVSQISVPLQALPSEQAADTAVNVHFFRDSLHASVVHEMLSLHTMGVPATQPVVALELGFEGSHFSTPVQKRLSLQRVSCCRDRQAFKPSSQKL